MMSIVFTLSHEESGFSAFRVQEDHHIIVEAPDIKELRVKALEAVNELLEGQLYRYELDDIVFRPE
ncbi:hypothetical protein D770_05385 [Flammeovirgaceae bacterium 311]|nr:hypothetical protein D770_05385 [Flammeovirgaceae bacterium 311]